MSAPETVSDPELQEVAWDLSDLLNGAGDDPQAGVDALLADAQTRADAFADTYAGKLAEIDGAGLIAAMHELAEIEEIAARAGTYAHLAFAIDTAVARPRRAAAARRGEGHRDRDQAAVLPPRVGGAGRREGRRSCSPPTGWTSPATT